MVVHKLNQPSRSVSNLLRNSLLWFSLLLEPGKFSILNFITDELFLWPQLDMNQHLIGQEILSLAETEVPPEDFVFHKFYVNKMNSTKKTKKKKKKGAEDEAAEELFGTGSGDDESDNEEIDNILDSADLSLEADGAYDYDDLDRVANEDDDDLAGDVSDADDLDIPEGEEFDDTIDDVDDDNVNDDDIELDIGDADDGSDGEDVLYQRKRKRKSGLKSGASPFASLEEYEHLLNEEDPAKADPAETEPKKKKKRKSQKKKKRKSSE